MSTKTKRKNEHCGECINCLFILQELENVPKKKRRKKQNALSIGRACLHTTRTKRKTEDELLRATNCIGGRSRGSDIVGESAILNPRERPPIAAFKEVSYNSIMFSKYSDLVKRCSDAAELAISNTDIRTECTKILKKMNDLVNPLIRNEVDYEEAYKECFHIYEKWSKSKPIGFRPFIPSKKDKEDLIEALEYYSAAIKEREKTHAKWLAQFGDDGTDIFNEILSQIKPKHSMNIPLVNQFLSDFLKKIQDEDTDLTFYDMEQWLADACVTDDGKEVDRIFNSGSSSKLIMEYFGMAPPTEDDDETTLPANQVDMPVASDLTAQHTKRRSKIQRAATLLRDGIARAGRLRARGKWKMANLVIDKMITNADSDKVPARAMKSGREKAKVMEDTLFSGQNLKEVAAILRVFRNRPAVREVSAVNNKIKDKTFKTKQEKLNDVIWKSLHDFFKMFTKGKGQRLKEDQNAIDAALAALTSPDISKNRLSHALGRALGVTHRQIKRAQKIRNDLDDKDSAHWVRADTRQYLSSVKDGEVSSYCFTQVYFIQHFIIVTY